MASGPLIAPRLVLAQKKIGDLRVGVQFSAEDPASEHECDDAASCVLVHGGQRTGEAQGGVSVNSSLVAQR